MITMNPIISFDIKHEIFLVRLIRLLFWSSLPYIIILTITLTNRNELDRMTFIIIISIISITFLMDFILRRLNWIKNKITKINIYDKKTIIEYVVYDNPYNTSVNRENFKMEKISALTKPPTIGLIIYNSNVKIGPFYSDQNFNNKDYIELYSKLKNFKDVG